MGENQSYVVAQLNARLQPVHRSEFFEDPLEEVLVPFHAHVSGGGSLVSKEGEIEYCDIEISTTRSDESFVDAVVKALEHLGAPRGSTLHVEAEKRQIPFGSAEGIAVYLNGTDLPDEVYAACDSDFVLSEFERLLGEEGRVLSYWQGPRETAFYMYGRSFLVMKERLAPFLSAYPLCARCRIEQIA